MLSELKLAFSQFLSLPWHKQVVVVLFCTTFIYLHIKLERKLKKWSELKTCEICNKHIWFWQSQRIGHWFNLLDDSKLTPVHYNCFHNLEDYHKIMLKRIKERKQ